MNWKTFLGGAVIAGAGAVDWYLAKIRSLTPTAQEYILAGGAIAAEGLEDKTPNTALTTAGLIMIPGGRWVNLLAQDVFQHTPSVGNPANWLPGSLITYAGYVLTGMGLVKAKDDDEKPSKKPKEGLVQMLKRIAD